MMRRKWSALDRGVALVDPILVVVVCDVLAVIVACGFVRALRAAKTIDARERVAQIARNGLEQSFDERLPSEEDLLWPVRPAILPCGSANFSLSTGIPRGEPQVALEDDKADAPGNSDLVGWKCLSINFRSPSYYRFGYFANVPFPDWHEYGAFGDSVPPEKLSAHLPTPLKGFVSFAEGDLDGDGVSSAFGIAYVYDPSRRMFERSPLVSVDELE